MAVIKPIDEPWDVDVKRFRVPVVIEDTCKQCGCAVTWNERGYDYLSYPTLNVPTKVVIYCRACDVSWPLRVLITVGVRLLEDASGSAVEARADKPDG